MSSWRGRLRAAAYWTVPAGLYERLGLGRRRSTCLAADKAQLLAPNAALRNRHRGQRAFILATGPSIKQQNLRPLRDEVCLAVSNFFVHPDYAYIRPRYHCVAPYHAPIAAAAWAEWMRELDRSAPDTVFFCLHDRARNEEGGRFANRSRHYYLCRYGETCACTAARPAAVDLTQPVAAPRSVTILALQIALYMGFSEIYLLGLRPRLAAAPARQHALLRGNAPRLHAPRVRRVGPAGLWPNVC